MIVYKKLEKILQDRNMQWKSLCDAGISVNMPAKFSKNKPMNTDIINKVCEYLQVQPSEIMEWIPDADYNKANEQIASIDAQIAELMAKKKELQK
jgi:DNA-binding Xre family transcriptional regulator